MQHAMRTLTVLLLATPMLSAVVSAGQAEDMRRRKKLIATGWDKVDSQRLLDNLELMEKRPFDGVVIAIVGRTGDDKPCHLRAAFHNQPWHKEWFEYSVDRLKQCRFKRFTDNFITVGANPGNVDWFDDDGWKVVVDHWRVAASVGKRLGFKGILFDPEPYTPPHAQFRYEAQADHDKHTFNEYCVKARLRGREVMQAIVDEHPDITLFCYFMNSVNSTATGHADPRVALAALGYGLYPAFIDGWLDVVPPEVTLVDGCESAYRYNSQQQYLEAAVRIKGACQELVAPENRAKYRAQVQVSFGVYLDAYWNPKDSKYGAWYIDGLGGPRVERLRANLHTALRVADQYVWIYGEKFRWWPTPNGRVNEESWPEALPGCEDALRFVRDPIDYARTKIAEQRAGGMLANVARNGDFASETTTTLEGTPTVWKEGRPPAGWSAWQEAKSEGTFTWDRQTGAAAPGSARACGVSGGCFLQSYRVQPGQRWAVRAMRKIIGRGQASIRVRWQTSEGGWTLEGLDQLIFCPSRTNDWSELFGVAEVPDGVGRLVILLGVKGQKSPDDVVWYDDIELYQLK